MPQCCSFRCSFRSIFWGLAALGVVADQVTKYRVFRWLYEDSRPTSFDGSRVGEYEVVSGVFRLQAYFTGAHESGEGLLPTLRTWSGGALPGVNHGALFGLGNVHGEVANTIFAVISIVAAVAIVYWGSRRTTSRDGILTVSLGLILAGTLGNLYDRLVFGGVRDFLDFYYIKWPVFNVADCCLVSGACLLLVQAFWARSAPEQPTLSESAKKSQPAGANAVSSDAICEQPSAHSV
jgi:signal peptidase II